MSDRGNGAGDRWLIARRQAAADIRLRLGNGYRMERTTHPRHRHFGSGGISTTTSNGASVTGQRAGGSSATLNIIGGAQALSGLPVTEDPVTATAPTCHACDITGIGGSNDGC